MMRGWAAALVATLVYAALLFFTVAFVTATVVVTLHFLGGKL